MNTTRKVSRPLTALLALSLTAIFALLVWTTPASATNAYFITTWQTDTANSVTIPTAPSSTYDYAINWGDGTTETNQTGNATHKYAQPGEYTITITGTFPRLKLGNNSHADKLLSVDNWGPSAWESMVDAFAGADNLVINATDTPNLSQVTSLSGMFQYAENFNSPIGNWNVSNVQSIASMFEEASSFNQDLSGWDTSNIRMFTYAFNRATSFNQDLSNWDTSNALSMNGTFAFASSFDQPVNTWDLSRVNDIRDMFANATSFNQDVSGWDTSNVIRMESAFRNAVRFDQDLSVWDYSSIKNANYFFHGSRIPGLSYDALLTQLASASSLERDVVFDVGTSTYCFAGAARQTLIDTYNWTIEDNGQDTASCGSTDIQFNEGLAATVNENESPDSVVGEFITVHPNVSSGFEYTFCASNGNDEQYFSIQGNQLLADVSFDFENPLDASGDNVYELCIVSTDPVSGFSMQRTLTAAVIDLVDPDNNGSSDNGSNSGQVLSDNTGNDPNVLAESDGGDSSSNSAVLAATGIAVSVLVIAGLVIAVMAYLSKKSTYTPKRK